MISAFVLFMSNGKLGHLIARRLLRIMPLYWLVTGVAILIYPWMYGNWIRLDHIIHSLLLIPPPRNFMMPILYPAWTLTFDLAFMLVIFCALSVTRRYGWGICLGVILIFALCPGPTGIKVVDYYFNERILSFGAGIALAWAVSRGLFLPSAAAIAGLPLSFIVILLLKDSSPIWWTFGVAILFFSALSLNCFFERLMVWPMLLVSTATYSIFLVHPLIIWQLEHWLPEDHGVASIWYALSLSVGLGLLVHQVVERPLTMHLGRISTYVAGSRLRSISA